MNTLTFAWRNLWRNKRRTLITVGSVFFGVILSTLMGSMQEGSYSSMINNVVKFYSGYIQIHHEDYWENKSINNVFEPSAELMRVVNEIPEVTQIVPRLEDFALVSYENATKGVMVMGVMPSVETRMTSLANRVIKGKYLSDNDTGVLLGSDLAAKMKLNIGDTLVLIGQGFQGNNAAGLFAVRGIIKHSNPDLNRRLVVMELKSCQTFYSAPNRLTSMALMLSDNYQMKQLLPLLKGRIASPYKVMSWEEMFPIIIQQIESDRSTAMISKIILYVVIGFGIFGTILMMMAERKHEFGVMVACGMPKIRLSLILVVETIFIAIIGALAGLLGSMPVVGYFYHHPVPITGQAAEWMADLGFEPFMFFDWSYMVFLNQMLAVFFMALFISLVPLFQMLRFKELKAMKS